MAEAIKSITSRILDLPPSCIAFVPTHPRLFVVGTYYLHPREEQETLPSESKVDPENDAGQSSNDADDEEERDEDDEVQRKDPQPQKRSGSLILFDLDPETSQVTLLQTLPISSAVLDIQWRPSLSSSTVSSPPLLATATSTGSVHFHTLASSSSEAPAELQPISTHQLTDSTAELCLYFAWHPTRPDIFGATFNDGNAKVYSTSYTSSPAPRNELTIHHIATLPSHSLETWFLSFSPTPASDNSSSVYTGGDDGLLLVSSLPLSHEPVLEAINLHTRIQDRKSHQAGVTSILPLPASFSPTASQRRELVLTGSYDDHIRLLSLPVPGQTGRVQVLAEMDLGGGVWRLSFLSSSTTKDGEGEDVVILASCMHAGTRIVRLHRPRQGGVGVGEEGDWEFEVLARFEEHQSMNYGSDVQPVVGVGDGKGRRRRKIVSTSFYDRLLCVWDVEL
ncbi:uncharacterized protein MYCGRDRAFT_43113 [Zymoseptoria tritici IPO323]|uniref:methylated diphthine methylhydrolase n=1 Tax=Zymoseptoria tritici (strain CBS 115943 / IPO323) TaxID=336722 RepID=F9XED9_ZYMTI|nr:uncharacterized protein MYCGRDRAFT_43113 [Zymoseptoria tritici IPO323]EGP86949.1 hypothetical protein MYCGRDRAFT_43113 [Zymoseptoria tritici IPO323]